MEIHVVVPGDSLYSIALRYGVPLSRVIEDNQLDPSLPLVVGQTIVILHPQLTYTVQLGQTALRIADMYGLSLRQLYRNNPGLHASPDIYPGQTLVISFDQIKEGTLSVNGYAYPFIDHELLARTVPYLTDLTPFTYGFTEAGELVPLDDTALIRIAKTGGCGALMHLSTLAESGNFSSELAHRLLQDPALQQVLIGHVEETLWARGYDGLDVDFEYIGPEDARPYAGFIQVLTQRLNPQGFPVISALAPKTSSTQRGQLYEGHDYRLLGQVANQLLLMTYEWGYTYGPPMAVAPLPNVRRVVEYALTEIPGQKLWLGIPNYGYDWPLPFTRGSTKATSISNVYAVELARTYGAEIQYDLTAQAPWFRYWDASGREHEVWFEDARSIRAKLALIPEYRLYGAGYWNLMRPFPQNWALLNALYYIRDPSPLT